MSRKNAGSEGPDPAPPDGMETYVRVLIAFSAYLLAAPLTFAAVYTMTAALDQFHAVSAGLAGIHVHWAANFGSSFRPALLLALPLALLLWLLAMRVLRRNGRRTDRQDETPVQPHRLAS